MHARYQQQQQQQQHRLMKSAQQQHLQQQMVGQQNIISPGSSMNSFKISPFAPPQMNGAPSSVVPVSGILVEVVDNVSGQSTNVYKIISQHEGRTGHKSFGQQIQPSTNGDQKMSTIHTESHHSERHHDKMPIAPAPSPPVQYQDHDLISPRMQIKEPPPLPPPPPPPQIVHKEDTFDRQKGTFSFTDKTERARTVRIGTVIWPPPNDDEEKQQREVGRLEIDEKFEKNLKEKYSGKKWKKPEPKQPVARKESAKKTKSLAETVHLATLQLLENKLGGNKVETHSGQVQTDELPTTPPPPRHEVVHYACKIIDTITQKKDGGSKSWTLRYVVLLLILMLSLTEAESNIEFDLMTKPAYFGKNVTVYCRMASLPGQSVNHMAWFKNITSQVALNSHSYYPSKYQITVEYKNESMYYYLTILRFAVDDVNILYRCDFGFDSHKEPLNLESKSFIALPKEGTTQKSFNTTNEMLTGFVRILNIYPKPRCEILYEGHNYTKDVIMTLKENQVFYNVTLTFASDAKISRCHGVLNISCYFGTRHMSILEDEISVCDDIIYGQYEDRKLMKTIVPTIIAVATLMLILYIMYRCRGSKCCRKDRNHSENEEVKVFV